MSRDKDNNYIYTKSVKGLYAKTQKAKCLLLQVYALLKYQRHLTTYFKSTL